jgi:hypothetical protein
MPCKDKITQAASARKHYASHKSERKASVKAWNAKNGALVDEFLQEYRATHPCVVCGEDEPMVLEFDHRDPVTKRFNLGEAVSRGWTLASVKKEVVKCDVRCANCHRRKTFFERVVRQLCAKLTAGWSSQVARFAHNEKVSGSNPLPATNLKGNLC